MEMCSSRQHVLAYADMQEVAPIQMYRTIVDVGNVSHSMHDSGNLGVGVPWKLFAEMHCILRKLQWIIFMYGGTVGGSLGIGIGFGLNTNLNGHDCKASRKGDASYVRLRQTLQPHLVARIALWRWSPMTAWKKMVHVQ
eukprot:1159887-Pelagomonas_calceolata.AAC.1